MIKKKNGAAPIVEVIVRRKASRRFEKLKQATADLPVKLSWDRRTSERRTTARVVDRDHRRKERRQPPPFSWEKADFVVVETTDEKRPRARITPTRPADDPGARKNGKRHLK